jgi:uncharacterized protein involved in response to NO
MIKSLKFPILDNSVRLFFTLASLWAIFVPCYTVCVIVNDYYFSSLFPNVYAWHGYEMIFGFLYTMIIGFALTASAHWSEKKSCSGISLALLALFWLLEKASLFFESSTFALSTNSLFIFYFLFLLKRQIGKDNNIFFLIITAFSFLKLFLVHNYIYYFIGSPKLLYNLSTVLVLLLVTIITGKIIPAFTKSYLILDEKPNAPSIVNKMTLISTFLLLFTTYKDSPFQLNFLVYIASFIFHTLRLSYWKPLKALKHGTIGLLHLANLVLCISLLYRGLSFILPQLDFYKASFHFTFMGGVTLIAMNIMIRAGLGHTGRKVYFGKYEIVILTCILAGTLLRVFLPLLNPDLFNAALHNGMGFWTLGFILYFIKFLPFFLKEKV